MTRPAPLSTETPKTTDPRLPVTLFTGFLGSGKTTTLNYLVRQPELRNALVIVNEFGAIGLDHELITHSSEDVVVEMSSGCLCCTIRGDLVKTLSEATWRFARNGKTWFDRVLIETTGLADPAPILHTLMKDEKIARQYRLDGVVTTLDAVTAMTTMDRQTEAVKQAAVADRILITKTDIAAPEEIENLIRRVRLLNPGAQIACPVNGEISPDKLLHLGLYRTENKPEDVQNWLNAEAMEDDNGHGHDHHDHHHDINRHDDHIRAICLTVDDPMDRIVFDTWMEALMMLKGPDLLRVKGIINLRDQDGPMVIHGVQHVLHDPVMMDQWPSNDRRSRIVFIARDLEEQALRETLEMFTAEDAAPINIA